MNKLIEQLRDMVTETGSQFPWSDVHEIHGPEVYSDFASRWTRADAERNRQMALFGHSDKRKSVAALDDMSMVYFQIRYAFGAYYKPSQDERHAEVGQWLLNEATPDQIILFAQFKAGELTLEPEDEPRASMLMLFVHLLEKEARLPTYAEFRDAYFRKRKTVISGPERIAFKRNLEAIGLDGLPVSYSGPHVWPDQEDSDDPFEALGGDALHLPPPHL